MLRNKNLKFWILQNAESRCSRVLALSRQSVNRMEITVIGYISQIAVRDGRRSNLPILF